MIALMTVASVCVLHRHRTLLRDLLDQMSDKLDLPIEVTTERTDSPLSAEALRPVNSGDREEQDISLEVTVENQAANPKFGSGVKFSVAFVGAPILTFFVYNFFMGMVFFLGTDYPCFLWIIDEETRCGGKA